ncbi:MAG: threonylcarbamoyl-AMP synthase [Pseudomonadaceae bacterium]|nr:threonylcarbamoyl-AMP synthase [Pseudomonadaceae bacterium]
MSQFFEIHPDNPQQRLIQQAVTILRNGGVIAYPTDSAYALGCCVGEKKAVERIKRIRNLDDKHNFTLMCADLSDLSVYAKVDNTVFRMLKNATPGPYTFILNATSEVPRLLLHPKRRTIGLRVPDHTLTRALLAELGTAMMSVTLIMPDEELPLFDAETIQERLDKLVDLVIDGGACSIEPTSVINLCTGVPEITREGRGDLSIFGS